ncbi:MAG: extracellular solute-binding protein [Deltaproteobacteria bacterium]|nr:extracellular solute-binding protein [Deltaproteobacteria bacterium]
MIAKFPYGKVPFWLLVIAVASMVTLLLTRRARPPRPDLILVTFSSAHFAAYKNAIPRFEQQHNVKVQIQQASWTALQSRLQNAILAGTEVPDLVEVFARSLGFFTRGPVEDIGLLDLTDRLRDEGLSDRLVPSRLSLWSERGRVYAIPHDVHPIMLAYRRDLVEQLGIDVRALDTWDKFVKEGQRITGDLNGDGTVDRYMIDLPYVFNWGLFSLLLQNDGQIFGSDGRIAFNSPAVAETFLWYVRQTQGPKRIAWDSGTGQSQMKAASDGLVIFHFMPDWRSYVFQTDLPSLAGKMALMPMPAWRPGGRRTSVWGGTGLVMMKQTKQPKLAWELAKFLYFDGSELGKRFAATNIIPPVMDAWDLPEFKKQNPYYSNQAVGSSYAALARETPPVYSSAVDELAQNKLGEAYSRVVEHYKSQGEAGLPERIREELTRAADYVQRVQARNARLSTPQ